VVVGVGYYPHHLTLQAMDELKKADIVIGHESLLSTLSPYIPRHALQISDPVLRETTTDIESLKKKRVMQAIRYAQQGKRVVYVCPGDPGLYSYAQPILEYASPMRVKIIPGITAALAVAATLGAPLRDGCAIIGLYEERVDPNIIKKRFNAAIQSDFVMVLYLPKHEALLYPQFYPQEKYPELYPREPRCTERLKNAFERCAKIRSSKTPVGISCIQEEDRPLVTTLGNYGDVFDDILPYSTIIIGNSMSVYVGDYFVTSLWRNAL
jgi:precorrin-3B methylase